MHKNSASGAVRLVRMIAGVRSQLRRARARVRHSHETVRWSCSKRSLMSQLRCSKLVEFHIVVNCMRMAREPAKRHTRTHTHWMCVRASRRLTHKRHFPFARATYSARTLPPALWATVGCWCSSHVRCVCARARASGVR